MAKKRRNDPEVIARLARISRDLERITSRRMTGEEREMFEGWFEDGFELPQSQQNRMME